MTRRKALPPTGLLPAVDPRQHLTTTQIARELAITRQTVRRSLDAAGVEYMSRGCQRYYTRAAIDAFIARHTVNPRKVR